MNRELAVRIKRSIPSLNVRMCGTWVWIDGDTLPHRKELREFGAKWSKNKGKWYVTGRKVASRRAMDWQYIKTKYLPEDIAV